MDSLVISMQKMWGKMLCPANITLKNQNADLLISSIRVDAAKSTHSIQGRCRNESHKYMSMKNKNGFGRTGENNYKKGYFYMV